MKNPGNIELLWSHREEESLYVACDPGKMSGLAVWADDDLVSARQLTQFDTCDVIEELAPAADAVIMETYTITPATTKKSRQHWSLEIIGTARWICNRYGTDFVLQTPAAAKAFASDDKLKTAGLWQPGQDHAVDAIRHMVLYLATNNLIDLKRLIG